MVGPRRAEPGRARRQPRRDDSQRRAADAGRQAGRVGVGPAVVPVGVSACARGGHAAGRPARRPDRAPQGHARRARAVRARLAGLRVLHRGGAVHRGAGTARRGRRGHHRHGAVGVDRAVHQAGAAEGGRGLGRGQLRGAADRADPRRLAAHQLLVGLGVPDQRAGGAHRHRRDDGAGPRLTRPAASRPRPDRDPGVDGGPGRRDLRAHRGGSARLGQPAPDRAHGRRCRSNSRLLRLGARSCPAREGDAGRPRLCSGRTPTRGVSSSRRSASWP